MNRRRPLLPLLLSLGIISGIIHATPVFADETIALGLTLTLPSQGARNWGTLYREEFAKPISAHRHTGAPDGNQLVTNSYSDNSVTGPKIRLANNEWLRARNFANNADVNVIRLNTSNQAEFASALALNLATPLAITSGGTGAATAADARTNLGLGTISTLDSPLPVANGGTAGTSQATARSGIGAAASGANADITSMTALTTIANPLDAIAISAANGGSSISFHGNPIQFASSGTDSFAMDSASFYSLNSDRDLGKDSTGNRIGNIFLSGAITATSPQNVRAGLGIGSIWNTASASSSVSTTSASMTNVLTTSLTVDSNDLVVCVGQMAYSSGAHPITGKGVALIGIDVDSDGTDETQMLQNNLTDIATTGDNRLATVVGMKQGLSGSKTCALRWATADGANTIYSTGNRRIYMVALGRRA